MKMEKMSIEKFNNCSISQKIKTIITGEKIKFRGLFKDVFEKSTTKTSNDNQLQEQYISRGIPNSVGTEKDLASGKSEIIIFFDEDIEKMKTMSIEDAKKYQVKLIIEKKYKTQNS